MDARIQKRTSVGGLVRVQVYEMGGLTPVVHPSCYVHPSAVLIGDVIVEEGVYLGPCASLRGDFGRIIIRRGSNVQDNCCVHGFPGNDTVIGENGHIGHGAVIHSCRLGKNVLIGMNSVVNDDAEVGDNSIVAAMSFVKAKMIIPPGSLVMGSPAKVIRALSEAEMAWKMEGTVVYQHLRERSKSMRLVDALSEVEAQRPRMQVPEMKPLSSSR
ncbi:MAG: phenylacetic acid degradation protein PaaY [Pseudomonadota bacterium]|jgi:phenylacetic acid degradation protein